MTNSQSSSISSFAIMQADIDKALHAKRQSNANVLSAVKSDGLLSNPANVADNIALDAADISRVIEMAWEDRTPFAAIEHSYCLNETDVIKLMRQQLRPASFRLWRQRVTGRATKHQAKRTFIVGRAYCATQYKQR